MSSSILESIYNYSITKPNKIALADDTASVTYSEYFNLISRYAYYFNKLNIVKNDKIVLEACQTISYLAIIHALGALGAIFVPLEHNCAIEKISSVASKTNAKIVIVSRDNIAIDNKLLLTYSEIDSEKSSCGVYVIKNYPLRSDVSEILFSTGTTGKEKGIVISNQNNIALAENVIHGVEMEEDNVEMIPSPMNHSHGLRRYYANMYNGSTVILLSSVLDIRRFFSNMEQYNVNSLDLVPSALSVILKLSKDKLSEYSNVLRYIQLGSAPLLENDKNKICQLLPNTRLYNFYGSTESGCTCIYNFNNNDVKDHCIGKPTFNTELLIVDDNRNIIESSASNTGLIATKGDMNMVEYYEDKEETLNAKLDGIVYSNDNGYIDEDGEIILLGRKGDVINIGGKKVSPEEIENAANEMPIIVDCACIPIDDESKGQVPKLFVKTKKETDFDQKEIRIFLSKKLEPFKIPVVIEYINEIPRSFNGKILRKNLK